MVDITDWNDLDGIRNGSETYTLTQDLDSNTAGYSDVASSNANSNSGWQPMGFFGGTLDGNGHTISDLVIDRPDTGVGFIGFAGDASTIKNLTFSNVGITGQKTGTIVKSGAPTIENCSVDGKISGTSTVGGLIGNANGGTSVTDSSVDADITASGSTVGGLIGNANATATITGSSTSGTLTGGSKLGGLVGDGEFNITNCSSSMDVTGSSDDSSEIGGLTGFVRSNSGASTIEDSHATGAVTGGSYLGGLVGNGKVKVLNCYAEGTVTGEQSDSSEIGGLAGQINSSFNFNMKVKNSHATGDVTGAGGYCGGLVGRTEVPVTSSYATGSVTVNSGSGSETGGLVGYVDGATITESFAAGNISGGSYLGGLIGYGSNSGGDLIVSSYALGDVTGEDNTGSNASEIGALAGYVGGGTVKQSYATGRVTADAFFNGLIGFNNGTVKNAYWDEVATGITDDSGSGAPLTTAEMTGDSADEKLSGFDFTDTWSETIGDGSDSTPTDGYPILQAIDASVQRTDAIFLQPPSAPSELTVSPA
jgi:hypothetical protein